MDLEKGLAILVEDWQDLHADGGTKQSAADVVGKLSAGVKSTVRPEMKPAKMAQLIKNHLQRTPGALENAEKFMTQFESAEELLEEIDLDCLMSDLSMTED
jgi:hypothetical protein